MQASDRVEFETILEELFAALDKPLTNAKREAFWMGLQRMTLIEFARCRDLLLEELSNGEPRRTFAVSDVWAAKRRLRARTPQVIEQPRETWQGDEWDQRANLLLLKHITTRLARDAHAYGAPPSNHFRLDESGRVICPHTSEQAACTEVLAAYKNAWAQDMRDWGGRPSLAEQQAAWDDCMQRAEAKLAKLRARYAQGAAA